MTGLSAYDGFAEVPSFNFLDGGTGDVLRGQGRTLDSASLDLHRAGNVELPLAGAGVTVERAQGELAEARRRVNAAAERHLLTAAAFEELQRAGADFLRDSPTDAVLEAAKKAAAEAKTALQGATGGPGRPEAHGNLVAAEKHFDDLVAKRNAATAAFDAAVERILGKLLEGNLGTR